MLITLVVLYSLVTVIWALTPLHWLRLTTSVAAIGLATAVLGLSLYVGSAYLSGVFTVIVAEQYVGLIAGLIRGAK